MKEIVLSIVIPVYNAGKYITNILEKLEEQQENYIEVILVDDGSTDNSLEICQRFASKNKIFKVFHQENKGASSARNQGIKIAEGEYIVFIDSDDDISNDFVKTIYKLCKKTMADIIQLDSYIVMPEKKEYKRVMLEEGEIEISKYCEFVLGQTVNALWDKVYKSKTIQDNNIYFDVDMVMGEDISFTLDVLKYSKFIYVDHSAVYEYKKNDEGLCSNVTEEYLCDLNVLYGKMEKFIVDTRLNDAAYEIMNKSMIASVFRAVGLAMNNGCFKHQVEQRLQESYDLQKLFKCNYKKFSFKVRKVLLNKGYFRVIAYLVNRKQS